MRVERPLFAAALSVFALGCAPESHPIARRSTPIIGGATDNAHDAVVLIYEQNSGFTCSGTLIAPDVVLTAAHCTVTNESCTQPNCVAIAPGGYQILGGTNPFNAASFQVGVKEVHPGPTYDGANFTGGDFGILVLDANAPVDPMSWLRLNTGSEAKFADGTPFTTVGFGLANAPTGPDTTGTKRTVAMTITSHDAAEFRYGGTTKNTCSGDSGGPAIEMIDGVETIIGVTSYGDNNCKQFGADNRTDTVDDFIGTYAASTGVGTPAPTPTGTATPVGTATPGPTATATDTPTGNGLASSASDGRHGCSVDESQSALGALSGLAGLLVSVVIAIGRRRR